jgi:hypothetical protein
MSNTAGGQEASRARHEAGSAAPGAALGDRAGGLAWFAAIPVTLGLMLGLPFGAGASLLAAAAIIALHRPLASRWVYARAGRRCLWCGGPPADPQALRLQGVPELRVCSAEASGLDRFLRFCAEHALLLRVGILVPVLGYFLLGGLEALGISSLPLDLRRHLFRVSIALSVLGVTLLHRRSPAQRPAGFPFPIHNLALLGVRWTLLIFLVVGLYWLGLSVLALLRPAFA